MSKNISTARSECTIKHENKASYNTNYIVPDLIDFFGDEWKEMDCKRNYLYLCNSIEVSVDVETEQVFSKINHTS